MDCTAAILKTCARSRSKWRRHGRSSVHRQWRPVRCCCGDDVTAEEVVSHASSILRCLLFYVCCCLSHEESPELGQVWVDRPVGRRGGSEDEGEHEGLSLFSSVLVSANRFLLRSNGLVPLVQITLMTSSVFLFLFFNLGWPGMFPLESQNTLYYYKLWQAVFLVRSKSDSLHLLTQNTNNFYHQEPVDQNKTKDMRSVGSWELSSLVRNYDYQWKLCQAEKFTEALMF